MRPLLERTLYKAKVGYVKAVALARDGHKESIPCTLVEGMQVAYPSGLSLTSTFQRRHSEKVFSFHLKHSKAQYTENIFG